MYGNLHPRIAMDRHNNPMVVWGDENGKAWFAKWGGETFSSPVYIGPAGGTVFATSWSGPDIAALGDTVYIVYKQMPAETGRIYLKHSYDGGKTFSIATEVDTKSSYIDRFPTVTTDEEGNPFVTFMRSEPDFAHSAHVVARSKDMGESFLRDTLGSVMNGGNVCDCSPASLVVSGTAGILLYRNNIKGSRNVWAGVSNNGCVSFNNGIRVDSENYVPESCPASGPDGVIVGDTLYSVYMSGSREGNLVYLSRISLSQPSLSTVALTGTIPGIIMQNFPRISGTGKAAAAVWTQTAGGNNQVCLAATNDLTYGFPEHFDTVADGVMLNADVAIGGGYIYVTWEDQVARRVMFRRGVYAYKKKAAVVENTSVLINAIAGKNKFSVTMKGLVGCVLIDPSGKEYEVDIVYTHNNTVCEVSTEDIEPGRYTAKFEDKEGRTYNAQVDVKDTAPADTDK